MEAATGVAVAAAAVAAAAMAAFVESLISLQVLKRLLSLLVVICLPFYVFVLGCDNDSFFLPFLPPPFFLTSHE